ncbi:hypothetical protein ACFLYO_11225, partial [Chloroflexota bacterium]
NDLTSALQKAKKGVKLTVHGKDILYEVMCNLCLLRVLFSNGDIADAKKIIRLMVNTYRENACLGIGPVFSLASTALAGPR